MTEPLLQVIDISKEFGGLRALNGLDFHVNEGEIVSVIGPNGAGKTTFFNVISGMFPPDSGDIIFDGHRLNGLRPNQITSLGMSRTFQNVRLFPNMTIRENVMVGQHVLTHSGPFRAIFRTPSFRREEELVRQKAEDILGFFGTRLVGYRLEQPAFVLSYANRRRLEIARAMASEPKLLLLDEPTAGMNPRESRELTGLIGRLRDERGHTIVMIEHDMHVVKGVSDRVVVLDYGRKIAEGLFEDVSQDPRVIEAYLGTTDTEKLG